LSVDSLEQEVRALVELVRLSRVTVLIAEDGSDKSAVLRSMVMPLLQDDRSGTSREIAVLFDWWNKAPLAVLKARIDEALARVVGDAAYAVGDQASADQLASRLAERERTFDCKFVIILDRFEEFLAAASDSDEIREFEAQFVEAVNSPRIHANFVLSLDERAARGLARLHERIPGLGDAQVRLSKVVPERGSPASVHPEASADRLVGSPAPVVVHHERHDEIASLATESEPASVAVDVPQKRSWRRTATALVVALLIVSALALLGIRRAGESDRTTSAAETASANAGSSTDAQREREEKAPAETPSTVTSSPEAAGERDTQPAQAALEKPPPAAASSSPSMAIPAPAASASEAPGPLLYIIIGNEAQREYAERIVAPLAHRGINVAGIRVAHAGPPVSDLRYFHSADRGEAATINRALDVIGRPAQRLRYVPGFEHQAPPKNYELWLPAR
jgi:hypothetical protein